MRCASPLTQSKANPHLRPELLPQSRQAVVVVLQLLLVPRLCAGECRSITLGLDINMKRRERESLRLQRVRELQASAAPKYVWW